MTNMYARCATVADVLDSFDAMTSPENLTCDGELSPDQVKARLTHIYVDRDARLTELGTGLPDYGMNATPAEAAVINAQGWNTDSLLTIVTGWDQTKGTRLNHMVQVAIDEFWARQMEQYTRH